MGIYMSFRGELILEPKISPEDIEDFNSFVYLSNYPQNERARYNNPWYINENGHLQCSTVKYGEHKQWFAYLYDKFFEPRGYNIYGTILYSCEMNPIEWTFLECKNGCVFEPHIEPVYIDMDFWETSAEATRKIMSERIPKRNMFQFEASERRTWTRSDTYGGIFDPLEEDPVPVP